jgi:hypothetical protein
MNPFSLTIQPCAVYGLLLHGPGVPPQHLSTGSLGHHKLARLLPPSRGSLTHCVLYWPSPPYSDREFQVTQTTFILHWPSPTHLPFFFIQHRSWAGTSTLHFHSFRGVAVRAFRRSLKFEALLGPGLEHLFPRNTTAPTIILFWSLSQPPCISRIGSHRRCFCWLKPTSSRPRRLCTYRRG